MTRILVTGGSGFIGTNLVEHYWALGNEVVNVDTVPPRNPKHQHLWIRTDLVDKGGLNRVVAEVDPEVVFHMGARTDLLGGSVSEYLANTVGVTNLIEALNAVGGLRLAVFASSMLVCRIGYQPTHSEDYCPTTAYGESKVEGERLVRQHAGVRLPWVIVRPTSIWGPWFREPYRDFFSAVQRGLYLHPKGHRIMRSYGFVLNAVARLARLAELDGGSLVRRTVYLADPPIELKHWADTIQEALGARPVREVPIGVLRLIARAGDWAQELGWPTPPLSSFRLNNLLTNMIHDISPWQDLGAIPYNSLEEGVKLTCQWMARER